MDNSFLSRLRKHFVRVVANMRGLEFAEQEFICDHARQSESCNSCPHSKPHVNTRHFNQYGRYYWYCTDLDDNSVCVSFTGNKFHRQCVPVENRWKSLK